MNFTSHAARGRPTSGYNPADQPAAGVSSMNDTVHDYPYSRRDNETYVASSNQIKTTTTGNSTTGKKMYRSDLVRSALTNTPHPDFIPVRDSARSGHSSGSGTLLLLFSFLFFSSFLFFIKMI